MEPVDIVELVKLLKLVEVVELAEKMQLTSRLGFGRYVPLVEFLSYHVPDGSVYGLISDELALFIAYKLVTEAVEHDCSPTSQRTKH